MFKEDKNESQACCPVLGWTNYKHMYQCSTWNESRINNWKTFKKSNRDKAIVTWVWKWFHFIFVQMRIFYIVVFDEISQLKYIASSKTLWITTIKHAKWFLVTQFINKQHEALFTLSEHFQVEKQRQEQWNWFCPLDEKIVKPNNTQSWRARGEMNSCIRHWWKFESSLAMFWMFKCALSFDPEILIPEVVPTEVLTHIRKNIQTNTAIAALCEGGRKPKYPSVDE